MNNKAVKDSVSVSLYLKNPPQLTYLHENEKICENRLKLYRIFHEASRKYEPHKTDWVKYVLTQIADKELYDFLALLHKEKIKSFDVNVLQNDISKLDDFEIYYRTDEIAHFLLALACSVKDELKSLFLDLETHWFQLKFELNVSDNDTTHFLEQHNIVVPFATADELFSLKKDLTNLYDVHLENHSIEIFKTSFVEAPSLLKNRQTIIKYGYLFFPNKKKYLSEYLQNILRKIWRNKLDNLSGYWENPRKDERILELVDAILPHMKKLLYYCGQIENGTLSLDTIDKQSRTIFPLCMSQLHDIFREKSHLKHQARIQYAIFLKNAGMPYEDAIAYFENEMTSKISKEDFRKLKYFYYFSHCFGQVGGKIDYLPQSCDDIINNTPNGTEEHGCPFAHYSSKSLSDSLLSNGVKSHTLIEILEEIERKQYRRACSIYFRDKVGTTIDDITSPNSYYSCALENCDIVDIEDIFSE